MTHDMAAISGVSLAAYIMEQVIAADTYAAISCAVGEWRNIWVSVTKGKGAIYIKTLIGIAFMYFFGLVCPTFGGMSQMGIKILGVFIGLIFMTCVGCDLFSSSLLALLAFVLHGYYKASELISGWIRLRSDLSAYFCRGALL